MNKEPTSIWNEKYRIEKERREKLKEVMDEYDTTVYYPARKALHKRCKEETGHNWNFISTNPLGCPLFICNTCGDTWIDCSHLDGDDTDE